MTTPWHGDAHGGVRVLLEPVTPELRRGFHRLDAMLPPEFRAELIAGEIIVTRVSEGGHDAVLPRIIRQLVQKSDVEVDLSSGRGIETPHGHYIPALSVVELDAACDELSWGTMAGVLMLVEITTSNSHCDRDAKRRAYAAAGVPLFLLIDRQRFHSVLFSRPDGEAHDYQADVRVPFGSDLELPAPFSFTLTDFTPRA